MRHYRHRIERDLRALLKGDVEFDPISRYLYSTDAGLSQVLPMGVVSPRDADDVLKIGSLRGASTASPGAARRGFGTCRRSRRVGCRSTSRAT